MVSELPISAEQGLALEALQSFVRAQGQDAFVLCGGAGTGKTTLIAHLVRFLESEGVSYELLAPTGRASRILAHKVGQHLNRGGVQAQTVHSTIYQLEEEVQSDDETLLQTRFRLRQQNGHSSVLIVDESSLIGDINKGEDGDLVFGSGRLLFDLVSYAKLSESMPVKIIFVGDSSQLPPVGEKLSPALDLDYLTQTLGLKVQTFALKQVQRQSQDSAILERSVVIREAIETQCLNSFSVRANQRDIQSVSAPEAVSRIVEARKNKQTAVVVTSTNESALDYNTLVREQIWGQSKLPLRVHDFLMINQNSPLFASLTNGDNVVVMDMADEPEIEQVYIKGQSEPVLLSFRQVTLGQRLGSSVSQIRCVILENLLTSPHRELQTNEKTALIVHARRRHSATGSGTGLREFLKTDPYFHAVRVKYGYAVTAHKAQGGEWHTVVVDFQKQKALGSDYFFRWAYTAITRASQQLLVVNPPEFSAVSDLQWGIATAVQSPQPGQAPDVLQQLREALTQAWNQEDIAVKECQSLQYGFRYTLERGDQQAVVDCHYNKAGVLTSTRTVRHTDEAFAQSALASVATLQRRPMGANEPSPAEPLAKDPESEFVQEFVQTIQAAVRGSDIAYSHHSRMPYRLRVGFTWGNRLGELDFTYKGSRVWSSVSEVKGAGKASGLMQAVKERLDQYQRSTKESHGSV